MIYIDIKKNDKLDSNLDLLTHGTPVVKNTLITLSAVLDSIAKIDLKKVSDEYGLGDQNRIKLILMGLSEALNYNHDTGYPENVVEEVARAWSDSLGLPFTKWDKNGKKTATQFLAMLEAAGIKLKHKKKWWKRS